MKKIIEKATPSTVIASAALFLAIGGTAGAAGSQLLTGDDIQNKSLSSADLKDSSIGTRQLRDGAVTSKKVANGSLHIRDFAKRDRQVLVNGKRGATGAAGASATLESLNFAGTDVLGYQDRDALVTGNVSSPGFYLAIASADVKNTSGVDEYLDCGFDVDGQISGAAGYQTTAGNTTSGSSVTLAPMPKGAQTIKYFCQSTGSATYDISNIKMKLIKLATP